MKKIIFFLLLLLLSVFSSTCFAQSGLVGCYPLDNNANDYSGFQNNGTDYNLSAVPDRFGNASGASYFVGSGRSVLVSDSNFHFNTYTYSLWCYFDSLPFAGEYYALIAAGGNTADQSVLLGNNATFGHIGFGFGSWDSFPAPHACYQGFLPAINQWYHVVAVRDSCVIKLFINDTLVCIQTPGLRAGDIGTPLTSVSFG